MHHIPSKKIVSFFIGSFVCLTIIIARLAYLQVFQTLTFFQLSQKNFLRFEKIVSPRGNILDRNGQLLATNRPVVSLYWQGTGNKELSIAQQKILADLAVFLSPFNNAYEEILSAEKLNRRFLLKHDIPFETMSIIIEKFAQHPNLLYQTDFKRFYPHKHVASHIVGYLGGIHYENSGKMGLEKICENILKGEPGQLTNMVNSRGKYLMSRREKDSLLGGTIQTTLDLDLSTIAEESFPQDIAGAMIVMEAKTGNLLVLLSRPSFDPNIFLDPLSIQTWNNLQTDQPFLNRASNACYPPASLFKLVSTAAGLETGILNQSDMWVCHGHTNFVGRDYHCWQRKGHGVMTMLSAIAQSCNIPFFEVGKKIKIDTLAEYANKLGLGRPACSLLPEKQGLIPTKKWKRETKGESWWPGETLSAAIGQSFLLVTPLQIARMVGAICEGVLVTPRILHDEPITQEPVDISKETRDFLKRSMKQSIQAHGTSSQLKSLKNFEIFAKTGTAQTSAFEKRELAKEFLEQGWFVGHITYKDNEPLVVVILMEHVGSSRFVTAVALDFLVRYHKLIDKQQIDG